MTQDASKGTANQAARNCYEAINIEKDYSGVPVLLDVSLRLHPGEVVGLVGHNGAGKSTFLKVLSGAHKQSGGELRIDGEPVSFSSPSDAIAKGVSTVYQELSLLPNLTVAQNAWLGRELRTPGRTLDKKAMKDATAKLVAEFGLDVQPDALVGTYPVAIRQLLEIAIACSRDTKYLLLDEPTTALEGDQVNVLLDYLGHLAKERNIGILIVNHKLDELYRVSDRIVALMNGKVVIDAPTAEVDRHAVVAAIAGAEYADKAIGAEGLQRRSVPDDGKITLQVHGLAGGLLKGVDLEARAGQILGIYGLAGAGRTETLRAIAGINPAAEGDILVDGEPYHAKTPSDAMKRGIAFLTEERKKDGIVPLMNSYQNAGLPVLERYTRAGMLNKAKMTADTAAILNQLDLKGDPGKPIVSLSGGNQQKVLLARALAQHPHILLLDEPSKGVDIGAKEEIHEILRKLAHEQGMTVVMVSSEEEEVLEVSDKILVFGEGRVLAGPYDVADMTASQLRRLAWGESDDRNAAPAQTSSPQTSSAQTAA
ncbi:sugar ABC transporter ATP-binding protein [Bifidobacterium sp. CP2]|uniref:sugar ABC transporter ATP-binding protein n=1 Tax=Bifidobacterium sp. CP2 TaxID=2809025 RepID=UPI001BDD9716|nr:sugar ABC transporter ATP-binding protein [Bifidobacterium sp. CP2]MBT1182285.1 sugar ABC transporter ATP-binding protein [Bifidobacterium sp. CP2]